MELRKDLPIKYYIGTNRISRSYPDDIDVVYEICGYVMRKNKKKKNHSIDSMFIDADEIKNVFPELNDAASDDIVKNNLTLALKKLKDANMIVLSENRISITNEGLKLAY